MLSMIPGLNRMVERFAIESVKDKGTVLVVDDEETVLKICKGMIGGLGYSVDTAATGAEALAAVSASPKPIALVLLDMHLPDMTLEEVVFGLRKIDGTIRILVQSGNLFSANPLDVKDLEICGWLGKPFGFSELAAKLDQVMSDGGRG
ncbi:MAG: response regulator [Desulfobacterales bacterium]|nr:response regulator [Desulfobacterales bacterium]